MGILRDSRDLLMPRGWWRRPYCRVFGHVLRWKHPQQVLATCERCFQHIHKHRPICKLCQNYGWVSRETRVGAVTHHYTVRCECSPTQDGPSP